MLVQGSFQMLAGLPGRCCGGLLFGEFWLSITRNNWPSRLTGKIRDGYILTNLVVVQLGQDLTRSVPEIISRGVQDKQVI